MNSYQKNVVFVAAITSLVVLLYVPLRLARSDSPVRYDFILTVLENGHWHVSVMHLLVELAIVWTVAAVLIAVLKKPN